MKLKGIKIGDFISKYPIIQGGMGVGVSMHNLAGNVAKEGGIGIISTADIGYQDPEFEKNPMKANLKAIKTEIEEDFSRPLTTMCWEEKINEPPKLLVQYL